MEAPATLQQAIIHFKEFENCKAFMTELRWIDGTVRCPHCGSDHVTWLENARIWKCYAKHDRPRFSLKSGTIFEDSPISLDKWLTAVWLIVNCKNGISSYEVARDLGVSQKSAWFMDHRIRYALHRGSFDALLSGEVEADESFFGGKAKFMHKGDKVRKMKGKRGGPSSGNKAIVMGLLKRGGEVRTKVIANRKRHAVESELRANVELGSNLYTDALQSYAFINDEYMHEVIDHALSYVRGKVHTNGLENFWSLIKRAIKGTYVSVEPFHLFRYLDEQAWRYNNRKDANGEPLKDWDRFKLACSQIVGKRLTWDELTGETLEPPTCVNPA
jgi:transposase-like protein